MKKKKKKNYLPFILIFVISFAFSIYYYYHIIDKYLTNKKINDEVSEKAINYMEENYNIIPSVFYIENHNEKGITFKAVDMSYNGYDFAVKVYENDKYEDDYMNLVLGYSMYDDMVSSLEDEYNTNIITIDAKNCIYFGYNDGITIEKDLTKEDLLNQNEKEIYITISLSLVNNENLSDQEISNRILEWINNNIKNTNIDNINLFINFVNKSDSKNMNDINDANAKAKRYIELSENVEDVDIEMTNSSIYVRINDNFFIRPFVDE